MNVSLPDESFPGEIFFGFVDDRNLIFGIEPDSQNPFVRLIQNYFRNEKNESILTYCLIEQTTIKDLEYVGEVYLFDSVDRTGNEAAHKREHQKYRDLVEELKREYGFLPSFFKEWYELGAFLYLGNHHIGHPTTRKRQWCGPLGSDGTFSRKERDLHIGLDKHRTEKLLRAYCKRFGETFFKSSPYYAILIKPVGVDYQETVDSFPLGNVYLHFGLTENKPKEFFIEFLYKYLLIWFREKANMLIEGIEDKTRTEDEVTRFVKNLGYQNIIGLKNKMRDRVLAYSEKYFNSEERVQAFEREMVGMEDKIKGIFNYLITGMGQPSQLRIDKFNPAVFKDEPFWLTSFYQRRMLTLVTHLLSNKVERASLHKIHSYFVDSSLQNEITTTTIKHLRDLSLLPCADEKLQANRMYQQELFDKASHYEKSMLQKYAQRYIEMVKQRPQEDQLLLLNGIYPTLRG